MFRVKGNQQLSGAQGAGSGQQPFLVFFFKNGAESFFVAQLPRDPDKEGHHFPSGTLLCGQMSLPNSESTRTKRQGVLYFPFEETHLNMASKKMAGGEK